MFCRSLVVAAALTGSFTTVAAVAGPVAPSIEEWGSQTLRASVSTSGAEANGGTYTLNSHNEQSLPDISGNGRFVAFSSQASNLVPADTNDIADVFVHDLWTGSTRRVSVSSSGDQAEDPGLDLHSWYGSVSPSISNNGRYVVFETLATNLGPADNDQHADIYLHDMVTGTTERVSRVVMHDGFPGDSYDPVISGDGRTLAFSTWDGLRVVNRKTGRSRLVGDWGAQDHVLSSGGRYIAFMSLQSDLVPDDANGLPDIFVYDRRTHDLERVSVDSNEHETHAPSLFWPVLGTISRYGRHVTFSSKSWDTVPDDTNRAYDVFIRDREQGTTRLLSISSTGGQGNADSVGASLSAGGRYVAFQSSASNLVDGDVNQTCDIFVRDRHLHTTQLASTAPAGASADGCSSSPAMSGNGEHIAFFSGARNLIPNDTNGLPDVFIRR